MMQGEGARILFDIRCLTVAYFKMKDLTEWKKYCGLGKVVSEVIFLLNVILWDGFLFCRCDFKVILFIEELLNVISRLFYGVHQVFVGSAARPRKNWYYSTSSLMLVQVRQQRHMEE